MNDKMFASGEYRFEGFDLQGNKVSDQTFHNVLTQLYFTGIMKFLNQAIDSPNVADLNINYMATGTGTATALKSDTKLQTEAFRKAPASKTRQDTKFICKLSLASNESNFTITEIGTFANGTGTADSGTLISRANVNIEKNANISYLVTYTITMN